MGLQRGNDVEQAVRGDADAASFALSVDVLSEIDVDFLDRTCTAAGVMLYLSWGRIGNDGSHEMSGARSTHPPSTALRSIARSRNSCRSWLSSP